MKRNPAIGTHPTALAKKHTAEGLLARMLEDGADTFAKKVKWVAKHIPSVDDPQSFVGWVTASERKRKHTRTRKTRNPGMVEVSVLGSSTHNPAKRGKEGWHRTKRGYEGVFQGRHYILSRANIGGWDVFMQLHPGEGDHVHVADFYPASRLLAYGYEAKPGFEYQRIAYDPSWTKDSVTKWAQSEKAEHYRRGGAYRA